MIDEVKQFIGPIIIERPERLEECKKENGKFYKAFRMKLSEIPDDDLKIMLLAQANRRITGIYCCLVFFVVLTVIGFGASLYLLLR